MRFAGEFINQGSQMDKPVVPGFNAEDLQMTPEMTPGRSFSSPFEQEYLRDKHILHNPGSGVAFNPAGMIKLQILKDAVNGQPLNPGTVMSPKQEQEIYQPELTAPHQIKSPKDDSYMEMMKSGFV